MDGGALVVEAGSGLPVVVSRAPEHAMAAMAAMANGTAARFLS
jgi:hypothetical protein